MRIILKILLLFPLILSIKSCVYQETTEDFIKKRAGVDISSCTIINETDTHGGFHGDGDYLVVADCKEGKEEIRNQVEKWEELPLTENLELIMYGGVKEGVTYGYNLAIDNGIPKIENGYYYFYDRYRDINNPHSDKDLFNRYSFNFTIAFYDLEEDLFYYYDFDT